MPGREYNSDGYRYSINGQEKEIGLNKNITTALYWEYDSRIERRWNLDPKPRVGISDYSTFDGNPILNNDPNGDCPNCLLGLIGAGVGALVGGAIEAGSQLYHEGKVSNWKAVGGKALQGAVTGGVAGLTGGASLMATVVAGGVANGVGGAVSNAMQGKAITMRSVVTDVAVGAATGGLVYGAGTLIKNAGGKIFTSGVQHGTELHWQTMNSIAGKLADKGEKVYLNKWINTALGKEIQGIGNWKPDILSISKNGTINLTEVISPSQTSKEILNKVAYMAKILRGEGYKVTTKVVSEIGKGVK